MRAYIPPLVMSVSICAMKTDGRNTAEKTVSNVASEADLKMTRHGELLRKSD